MEIKSTELRQNMWYYRIYCIGLNTLFSSAFPLLSLLYLNVYTVLGEPHNNALYVSCPTYLIVNFSPAQDWQGEWCSNYQQNFKFHIRQWKPKYAGEFGCQEMAKKHLRNVVFETQEKTIG